MNDQPPALIYSPTFANHQTGEISLRGDDLLHHIADQELVDPIYTVAKLQYPYPVPGRVPNPEQPARTQTCYESLFGFGLIGDEVGQLHLFEPRPASLAELATVHTPAYLDRVSRLSQTGGELAESTYIGPGSYEIAALSAGAGLTAAHLIQQGLASSALVISRPPGHHAGPDNGAGFCIFNNVAVLAAAARGLGWPRVLIVDWDLHHGDGTQQIFYTDPQVLFCSLHQFGPELYPEKGDWGEVGLGPGRGYTVNLPLPAKTGEADYLALAERVLPALAEWHQPDLILVSAGYDGHFNDTLNPYVWDPAGGLNLTAQTYHRLTRLVAGLAARYCQGRYIILLEGGYNLYNLGAGVVNTAAAMLGHSAFITETLPPTIPVTPFDRAAYLQKLGQFHPYLTF